MLKIAPSDAMVSQVSAIKTFCRKALISIVTASMVLGSFPVGAVASVGSNEDSPTGDVVLSDVHIADLVDGVSEPLDVSLDIQGVTGGIKGTQDMLLGIFDGGALADPQVEKVLNVESKATATAETNDKANETASDTAHTNTSADAATGDKQDNAAQGDEASNKQNVGQDSDQASQSGNEAGQANAGDSQDSAQGAASSENEQTQNSQDKTVDRGGVASTETVEASPIKAVEGFFAPAISVLGNLFGITSAGATEPFAPTVKTADGNTLEGMKQIEGLSQRKSWYAGAYIYKDGKDEPLTGFDGKPYQVIAADKTPEGKIRYAISGSDKVMELGSDRKIGLSWKAPEAEKDARAASNKSDENATALKATDTFESVSGIYLERDGVMEKDPTQTYSGGYLKDNKPVISGAEFVGLYIEIDGIRYELDFLATVAGQKRYAIKGSVIESGSTTFVPSTVQKDQKLILSVKSTTSTVSVSYNLRYFYGDIQPANARWAVKTDKVHIGGFGTFAIYVPDSAWADISVSGAQYTWLKKVGGVDYYLLNSVTGAVNVNVTIKLKTTYWYFDFSVQAYTPKSADEAVSSNFLYVGGYKDGRKPISYVGTSGFPNSSGLPRSTHKYDPDPWTKADGEDTFDTGSGLIRWASGQSVGNPASLSFRQYVYQSASNSTWTSLSVNGVWNTINNNSGRWDQYPTAILVNGESVALPPMKNDNTRDATAKTTLKTGKALGTEVTVIKRFTQGYGSGKGPYIDLKFDKIFSDLNVKVLYGPSSQKSLTAGNLTGVSAKIYQYQDWDGGERNGTWVPMKAGDYFFLKNADRDFTGNDGRYTIKIKPNNGWTINSVKSTGGEKIVLQYSEPDSDGYYTYKFEGKQSGWVEALNVDASPATYKVEYIKDNGVSYPLGYPTDTTDYNTEYSRVIAISTSYPEKEGSYFTGYRVREDKNARIYKPGQSIDIAELNLTGNTSSTLHLEPQWKQQQGVGNLVQRNVVVKEQQRDDAKQEIIFRVKSTDTVTVAYGTPYEVRGHGESYKTNDGEFVRTKAEGQAGVVGESETLATFEYRHKATVTFSTNDSSESLNGISPTTRGSYSYEEIDVPSESPIKQGYKFRGWKVKGGNDGKIYSPGTKMKVPWDSATMVPVWEAEATAVKFNFAQEGMQYTKGDLEYLYDLSEGSIGALPTQKNRDQDGQNLVGKRIVDAWWNAGSSDYDKNYIEGWYTQPNGGGSEVATNDKAIDLIKKGAEVKEINGKKAVMLYANWAPRTFKAVVDISTTAEKRLDVGFTQEQGTWNVKVNLSDLKLGTQALSGSGSGALTPRIVAINWVKNESNGDFNIDRSGIGPNAGQGLYPKDGVFTIPVRLLTSNGSGSYTGNWDIIIDAGETAGGWNYQKTVRLTLKASVNLKERIIKGPNYDYEKETVNFTTDPMSESKGFSITALPQLGSYNADGTNYSLTNILDSLPADGKTIAVTLHKDANTDYAATDFEFTLSHRPAAPTLKQEPGVDGGQGKIVVEDNNDNHVFEYRLKGSKAGWTAMTGSGHEASVIPGEYEVRQKASNDQKTFASAISTIKVTRQWTVAFVHVTETGLELQSDQVKGVKAPEVVDTRIVNEGALLLPWNAVSGSGDVYVDDYVLSKVTFKATDGSGSSSSVGSGHTVTVDKKLTVTYVWGRSNARINFNYGDATFVDNGNKDLDWVKTSRYMLKSGVDPVVGLLPTPGETLNQDSKTVPFYKQGYVFVGWKVEGGSDTAIVTEDAKLLDVLGKGTEVTLVPVWRRADFTATWAPIDAEAEYGYADDQTKTSAATPSYIDVDQKLDVSPRIVDIKVTDEKKDGVGLNWCSLLEPTHFPTSGLSLIKVTPSSGLEVGTYTAKVTVTYDAGTNGGLNLGANVKVATFSVTFKVVPVKHALSLSGVTYGDNAPTTGNETLVLSGSDTDQIANGETISVNGLPSGVAEKDIIKVADGKATVNLTPALNWSGKAQNSTDEEWAKPDSPVTLTFTRPGDTNHSAATLKVTFNTRSAAPIATPTPAYGEGAKGEVKLTTADGQTLPGEGRSWEHLHTKDGAAWIGLHGSAGTATNIWADTAGQYKARAAALQAKQSFNGQTEVTLKGYFAGKTTETTIDQYWAVLLDAKLEDGSRAIVETKDDPWVPGEQGGFKQVFYLGTVKSDGSITAYENTGDISTGDLTNKLLDGWNDTFKAPSTNTRHTVWVKDGEKYKLPTFGSKLGNWETPGYDLVKITAKANAGVEQTLVQTEYNPDGKAGAIAIDSSGANKVYKSTEVGSTSTEGITGTTTVSLYFRERAIDAGWDIKWADEDSYDPTPDNPSDSPIQKPSENAKLPTTQHLLWGDVVMTAPYGTWDKSKFDTVFPGVTNPVDPEDSSVGYGNNDLYTRDPWQLMSNTGSAYHAFQVSSPIGAVYSLNPKTWGYSSTKDKTPATSWRNFNGLTFGARYVFNKGQYLVNFQIGNAALTAGEAIDSLSALQRVLFENDNHTLYRASKLNSGSMFTNPPVSVKTGASSTETQDLEKWIFAGYYPSSVAQGTYDPSKTNTKYMWDETTTSKKNVESAFTSEGPVPGDFTKKGNPVPSQPLADGERYGWNDVQLHMAARIEDANLVKGLSTLPLTLTVDQAKTGAIGSLTVMPEKWYSVNGAGAAGAGGGTFKVTDVKFKSTSRDASSDGWLDISSAEWNTAEFKTAEGGTLNGIKVKQGLDQGVYQGVITVTYGYTTSNGKFKKSDLTTEIPVTLNVTGNGNVSEQGEYIATMHDYGVKKSDVSTAFANNEAIATSLGLTVYHKAADSGVQTVIYQNGKQLDTFEGSVELKGFTVVDSKGSAVPDPSKIDKSGDYTFTANIAVSGKDGEQVILTPKSKVFVSDNGTPNLFWNNVEITLPEKDAQGASVNSWIQKEMAVRAFDEQNGWVELNTVTIVQIDSQQAFNSGSASAKISLQNAGPGQVEGATSAGMNATGLFDVKISVGEGAKPDGGSITGAIANGAVKIIKAQIDKTPSQPVEVGNSATDNTISWGPVLNYEDIDSLAGRVTANYWPVTRYELDGDGIWQATDALLNATTASNLGANTKHVVRAVYTVSSENHSDEVYDVTSSTYSSPSKAMWTKPVAPDMGKAGANLTYDFGVEPGSETATWAGEISQGDGAIKVLTNEMPLTRGAKLRRASERVTVPVSGFEGHSVDFYARGTESQLESANTTKVAVPVRASSPVLHVVNPELSSQKGVISGFDAQYVNVPQGGAQEGAVTESMYVVQIDEKGSWIPVSLSYSHGMWTYLATPGHTYVFRVAANDGTSFVWASGSQHFGSFSSNVCSVKAELSFTADSVFAVGLDEIKAIKDAVSSDGHLNGTSADLIKLLIKRGHATLTTTNPQDYSIMVDVKDARAAEGFYPVTFYVVKKDTTGSRLIEVESTMQITSSGGGSDQNEGTVFAYNFAISIDEVGTDSFDALNKIAWERAGVFGTDASGAKLTGVEQVDVTYADGANILTSPKELIAGNIYRVSFQVKDTVAKATVDMKVFDNGSTTDPDENGNRYLIFSNNFRASQDEVVRTGDKKLTDDAIKVRAEVTAWKLPKSGAPEQIALDHVLVDGNNMWGKLAGEKASVDFAIANTTAKATSAVTVYVDGTGPVDPSGNDKSSLFANDIYISREQLDKAGTGIGALLFESASAYGTLKDGTPVEAYQTDAYTVKVGSEDASATNVVDGAQVTFALTSNPKISATVRAHVFDNGGTTDPDENGEYWVVYSNNFDMGRDEAKELLSSDNNYQALIKRAEASAFHINAEGVRQAVDPAVDEASVEALAKAAAGSVTTGTVTFMAGASGAAAKARSTSQVTIYDHGTTTDPDEDGARWAIFSDNFRTSVSELRDDMLLSPAQGYAALRVRAHVVAKRIPATGASEDVSTTVSVLPAQIEALKTAQAGDRKLVTFTVGPNGTAVVESTSEATIYDGGTGPVDPSNNDNSSVFANNLEGYREDLKALGATELAQYVWEQGKAVGTNAAGKAVGIDEVVISVGGVELTARAVAGIDWSQDSLPVHFAVKDGKATADVALKLLDHDQPGGGDGGNNNGGNNNGGNNNNNNGGGAGGTGAGEGGAAHHRPQNTTGSNTNTTTNEDNKSAESHSSGTSHDSSDNSLDINIPASHDRDTHSHQAECVIHWIMGVGAVLTALYYAIAATRRRRGHASPGLDKAVLIVSVILALVLVGVWFTTGLYQVDAPLDAIVAAVWIILALVCYAAASGVRDASRTQQRGSDFMN